MRTLSQSELETAHSRKASRNGLYAGGDSEMIIGAVRLGDSLHPTHAGDGTNPHSLAFYAIPTPTLCITDLSVSSHLTPSLINLVTRTSAIIVDLRWQVVMKILPHPSISVP